MPTSLQNTRIIGDGIINDFDIFRRWFQMLCPYVQQV